jgi:hypothetical protein
MVRVDEGPDAGLVWHGGNPLTDQRKMAAGRGVLDLGAAGLRVNSWVNAGPDDPLPDGWHLVWSGSSVSLPGYAKRRASLIGGGFDNLVPEPRMPDLESVADPVGLAAWDALRIEAGVPLVDASGFWVRLFFDGSQDELPQSGSSVLLNGEAVGLLESSGQHHMLGPIGLARLSVAVPVASLVQIGPVTASVESIPAIPQQHSWN